MLFLVACGGMLSTGIGQAAAQQIIETEVLPSFAGLLTDGPIKVELIPSDENRMQIQLWDIDPRNFKWEIKNNTLEISTRKGMANKRAFANVTLYYTELAQITMTGGEIKTADPIVTGSLLVKAESSTGKMDLIVETNTLIIHASGDNRIKVNGTAQKATYRARLGSKIECLGVEADEVIATVSGKAEIHLSSHDTLEATARTGGNIFFAGSPEILSVKKSMGGGVKDIDNAY